MACATLLFSGLRHALCGFVFVLPKKRRRGATRPACRSWGAPTGAQGTNPFRENPWAVAAVQGGSNRNTRADRPLFTVLLDRRWPSLRPETDRTWHLGEPPMPPWGRKGDAASKTKVAGYFFCPQDDALASMRSTRPAFELVENESTPIRAFMRPAVAVQRVLDFRISHDPTRSSSGLFSDMAVPGGRRPDPVNRSQLAQLQTYTKPVQRPDVHSAPPDHVAV